MRNVIKLRRRALAASVSPSALYAGTDRFKRWEKIVPKILRYLGPKFDVIA